MDDQLPVGTRVRFNDRCVWPERIGAEGVVVAPPNPDEYPAPKARHDRAASDVLVLLDDDSIHRGRKRTQFSDGEGDDRERGWTCVTDSDSLDIIDEQP